ncbi:MAG: hypothetical protein AB7V26_11915 [Lysobacterales bacterium]
MRLRKHLHLMLCLLALSAGPTTACDLCAIYTAEFAEGASGAGFYAGVSEQYTAFNDVFEDGHRIDNPEGQSLDSYFTQLAFGYRSGHSWSLQVNLPYIDRNFRRIEGEHLERGSESGIGDISLLGSYQLFGRKTESGGISWQVLAGLEFGSGDSDRIAEELDEEHHDEGGAVAKSGGDEHGTASAVHGHDLALGNGATDIILGSSLRWHHRRWLGDAWFQHAIRARGDFGYDYANDTHWGISAGRYLHLGHRNSVALLLDLSGETKGEDDLAGSVLDDTAARSVLLGPSLRVNLGERSAFEIGAAWRSSGGNSGVQMLPDYRLRASVNLRF